MNFSQNDCFSFTVRIIQLAPLALVSFSCTLNDTFPAKKEDCEEAWNYVEFLKTKVTGTVNTILQVRQKFSSESFSSVLKESMMMSFDY